MTRRITFFLIGAVTVISAISLLVYLNPFGAFFDDIFKKKALPPLSAAEYDTNWHDGDFSVSDLPNDIAVIIQRFFECFYASLGDKNADPADELINLYFSGEKDSVYDLAALYSASKRLSASKIDLSLSSIKLHLWIENIVPFGNNGFIVVLKQSAELSFASLKKITGGEGNFLHTFIFERKSGNWSITSHECDGGAWKYSRKTLNNICGGDSLSYDKLFDALEFFRAGLENKTERIAVIIAAKGYKKTFPKPEISYDREAAAAYALKWSSLLTDRKNIERWGEYENDSGNFASQCIYAGIGKMDTDGKFIWKWFGDNINYIAAEEGRSMSWTEPDSFWLYCSSRDLSGLLTYTDISGGQLEKGDIVQLMAGGSAFASLVVSDIVTDRKGNKLDFLMTGHDGDVINYPLSLIHCDGIRMIKILGFS